MLGVDSSNANNSLRTFCEGAIVAGYPTEEVEDSVKRNNKAVGYAK